MPAVSVMLARARSAKAMRDSRIYWMLAHLELRMHLCPRRKPQQRKSLKVSLSLLESFAVAEPVWVNISVLCNHYSLYLAGLADKKFGPSAPLKIRSAHHNKP